MKTVIRQTRVIYKLIVNKKIIIDNKIIPSENIFNRETCMDLVFSLLILR